MSKETIEQTCLRLGTAKQKRTEYGRGKYKRTFDSYTVRPDYRLGFVVHGFTTHPQNSVLAGQSCKVFLDSFDTRKEALAIYPEANNGSEWTDPEISLSHLPDENDPVPGGMFPDDYEDGY